MFIAPEKEIPDFLGWGDAITYLLEECWDRDDVRGIIPWIEFDGLRLNRIDGSYVLTGKLTSVPPIKRAENEGIRCLTVNSAADLEVALKKFVQNPNIQLVTLLLPERPTFRAPAAAFRLWKYGFQIHADGVCMCGSDEFAKLVRALTDTGT
jgi:hypothetical protein